jgi:hypothetical protein
VGVVWCVQVRGERKKVSVYVVAEGIGSGARAQDTNRQTQRDTGKEAGPAQAVLEVSIKAGPLASPFRPCLTVRPLCVLMSRAVVDA